MVSGLPAGPKPPPGSHVLAPHTKHHRTGAPLPGGHTVPGPGPGVVAAPSVAPQQTASAAGGPGDRSFAAALRKLAKQAVPPSGIKLFYALYFVLIYSVQADISS